MFRFTIRDVLWLNKPAAQSRRWLQISLRGALTVFTLLGLFFGWYANRAWRQNLAVVAIRAQGGRVWYSSEETSENLPPRPAPFLAHYLGLDFVDSAVKVDFIGQEFDDADVLLLNDLPRLEQLQLHQTRITGSTFERVRTLRMVKRLRTNYTPLTDNAIAHFRNSELDYVMILNSAISNRAMEHLGTCKNLSTLWITNAPITDGGMQHVSGLMQLKILLLNHLNLLQVVLLCNLLLARCISFSMLLRND